jgi:hypothetical protein
MTGSPLIDAKKMIAKVSGDIQYVVGETPQPAQHVNYLISYRLNAGRLLMKSFEEVKTHA